MATGDTLQGWRGTLTVTIGATAHVLDFVGSWSATSSRETSSGKPPIRANGTGVAPKRLGSRNVEGSLEGEIYQGANTARAAFITAHEDGVAVDLVFEQESGLTYTDRVFITELEISTDSEEGGTITASFETTGTTTPAFAPST